MDWYARWWFAVCRKGVFNKNQTDLTRFRRGKNKGIVLSIVIFEHKGDKGEMLAMYRSAEDILNNQEVIYNISEMSVKYKQT